MNYTVIVDEKYFETNYYKLQQMPDEQFGLRQDIYDWLLSEIGPSRSGWNFQYYGTLEYKGRTHCTILRFDDESHAIEFKMRWS